MSARRLCFNSGIPEPARNAFKKMEEPNCPQQALFQEVVARAVLDACGFTAISNPKHRNAAVRDARLWLRFGKNVEELFEIAGLELKEVRRSVLAKKVPYRRLRIKRKG